MPKLKICGIKDKKNAMEVANLDVDYLGLIFSKSPRRVDLKQAKTLAKIIHKKNKLAIGVFTDEGLEFILKAVHYAKLDGVQIHRLIPKDEFKILKTQKIFIWQVISVQDKLEIPKNIYADLILFDTKGKFKGGNGVSFDWNLLKMYSKDFALAGGIGTHNVLEACALKPKILDINSKVEDENFLKNISLVQEIINKVKTMNKKSYYGNFGGQFLPETAMNAINELEKAYYKIAFGKDFKKELKNLLKNYVGRKTPLYHAKNLSKHYGHEIYLKREDLNHTGAHKINNALAQALLAKKMGKKKIIAETGAGQHGLATATAAALLGLECEIFMGTLDVQRQALNVYKMELLGAKVNAIDFGLKTLKEATTAAIQAWVSDVENLFYVIGSVVGPHPYPKMVTHFQSIIGKECKEQLKKLGKNADIIIAAVGGGSNAAGIFYEFLNDKKVRLIGIEAAGLGIDTPYHAATLTKGRDGIIHGMKTKVLQDDLGNILPVHSISAGLDYPGVGPMHAHLFETKRVEYHAINDDECINALKLLCLKEGIIPAIESAHALAFLDKICPRLKHKNTIIVNLSGRGDKDMDTIRTYEKGKIYG
ncbi:tryptophan synthase subunit beta [Campylobacter sp. US33a]|nr:tryptophan synthase subunit beta [Campylobacter sp. US33a]